MGIACLGFREPLFPVQVFDTNINRSVLISLLRLIILCYSCIQFTDQKVVEDPVFSTADAYFLSREEAFDRAMQKSVHYVKIKKELGLDQFESQALKE